MAKMSPEISNRLLAVLSWMDALGSEDQPIHVVLHTDSDPVDIRDVTPSQWHGSAVEGSATEELPQGGHSLPIFFGSNETVTGAYVHDSSEEADPGLDLPITTLRATPPQGHVTAPMTFDRDPGMDLPSGGFVPPERYPTNILPMAHLTTVINDLYRKANPDETEQSLRDAEAAADDRMDAAIDSKEVTRRTAITRAGYAIRDAGRITDSEAAWLMRWITDGNRPRETQ